jgi:hypothetical protein
LALLLSQNLDYLKFVDQLTPDSYLEDVLTIGREKYTSVADMVMQFASTIFSEGFAE